MTERKTVVSVKPDIFEWLRDDAAGIVTREVFDVSGLEVGNVIRYPAILRPEHQGVRSRVVIESIQGRTVHTLSRGLDGQPSRSVVAPMQLQDNGVLVEERKPPQAVCQRCGFVLDHVPVEDPDKALERCPKCDAYDWIAA